MDTSAFKEATVATPSELRAMFRGAGHTGQTAGLACGYVQANIFILPKDWAEDFLLFCQRNPSACPLLARGDAGDPTLPYLGRNIDIRTDLPAYHVFTGGEKTSEVSDISSLWRKDFVTFAIGCSFSFEEALLDAGLPLPYLDAGGTAGVYQTNREATPAGRIGGPLLVTMRPIHPQNVSKAIQITSRFPNAHGAPIHVGHPGLLGINLEKSFNGIGSTQIDKEQIPLFWACGLTATVALSRSKPPIFIQHAPCCMLITDHRNAAMSAV